MHNPSDALIVALDGDYQQARDWAVSCHGIAGWVKIGMTLYYELGPTIVSELAGLGYQVFLDLKMYDIPHQVEGAARVLGRLGVGMLTVHGSGGSEMIRAAKRGASKGAAEIGRPQPLILGVTVLTSSKGEVLQATGINDTMDGQVLRLARLAIASGADGIVCSPQEASLLREQLGDDFAMVTPGVRPAWASADDQARVATPGEAIRNGASHLVVGRPITAHEHPTAAARMILDEIAEAMG